MGRECQVGKYMVVWDSSGDSVTWSSQALGFLSFMSYWLPHQAKILALTQQGVGGLRLRSGHPMFSTQASGLERYSASSPGYKPAGKELRVALSTSPAQLAHPKLTLQMLPSQLSLTSDGQLPFYQAASELGNSASVQPGYLFPGYLLTARPLLSCFYLNQLQILEMNSSPQLLNL